MTAGHWDSIQITDGLEMYGRLCQSGCPNLTKLGNDNVEEVERMMEL